MKAADAFPLRWPEGWPRTPLAQRARSPYKVTPERATGDLVRSLKLLGASSGSIVISTNIPVRRDGLPYANVREPEDAGVAVWWITRAHGERVLACDRWRKVHENIRAIGLAVDGLRAIDRAGASQILHRAYSAFAALPAAPDRVPEQPWWTVLGFNEKVLEVLSIPVIEARHRELSRTAHPDRGGSHEAMTELNRALAQARAHFEKGAA